MVKTKKELSKKNSAKSTVKIVTAERTDTSMYTRLAIAIAILIPVVFFSAMRGRKTNTVTSVGNNSTTGSIVATATINSTGIDWLNAGDNNRNASATLQYRQVGSPTWTLGQGPIRLQNTNTHRSSIFWLQPATRYEYKIIINDPDGVTTPTLSGTFTTRADGATGSYLRTLYVATNGNDANAGTSQTAPLRTIQKAADISLPGDHIIVAPGTYRESVNITRSGTATNPILFESSNIAVNGGNPAMVQGDEASLAVVDTVDNWRADPAGNAGVYYTVLSNYASGDVPISVYRNNEKIYAYTYYPYNATATLTFNNFISSIYCPGGNATQCAASGVSGGYFYNPANKYLYVRLPDGKDPDLYAMHVAKRNSTGIKVGGASNVIVRGFGARYFHLGIAVRGSNVLASNNTVEMNQVMYNGEGIALGGVSSPDNLIARSLVQLNQVGDSKVSEWPWRAVKLNDVESSGISVSGTSANVIRRNLVTEVFNGINATSDVNSPTINVNMDVYENSVGDIGDDAIELDGAGVNVRAWDNFIFAGQRRFSGQSGFSLASISYGPTWVIRNTILDTVQSAFKTSYSLATPIGKIFIYHNTAVSAAPDLFALFRLVGKNQGAVAGLNATLRNNIFMATGNAVAGGNGENMLFVDMNTTHSDPSITLDMNHDLYFSNRVCPSTCPFNSWLSTRYANLSQFVSASGQEAQGIYANPLFVDSASKNFSLQSSSPAIDKGEILPGINNNFQGVAPDLGAKESSFMKSSDGSGTGGVIKTEVDILN